MSHAFAPSLRPLLLLTALLPLACGAHEVPPAPGPALETSTPAPTAPTAQPSASGSASLTASASAPAASTTATTTTAPTAKPPSTARIGDTTCAADADCVVTSQKECCDCCPSEPSATSGAWLSWRDGTQCKQTRCEPCAKNPVHPICPSVEPPSAFRAACVQKRCTLVRNP